VPFEITQRATHLHVRMHGVITAGDLVRLAGEAERIEDALPEALDRITELSEVSSFEVGYPEVSTLAERRRTRKFSRRIKSAIVARAPIQVGLARMFQTLNDNPQIELHILPRVEEALAWLSSGKAPGPPVPSKGSSKNVHDFSSALSGPLTIALVGDFRESVTAHRAIPPALELSARDLNCDLNFKWHATADLARDPEGQLGDASGIWCVPAGPYENTEAALAAIRFARESGLPFLGTCAGFQHALLEFARNALGREDASHAELDPGAANALITTLSCALVEKSGSVTLASDSLLAKAYGATETCEEYHCRYGLSPDHERLFRGSAMRIVGRDDGGEVRAVELKDHPFFVATLFQPERAALKGITPPLVRAFVAAALRVSRPAETAG
jgi:hypothetical protein